MQAPTPTPTPTIRSYQRALTQEVVLYKLGRDIRLPRAIPARGVGWFLGLVATAMIATHLIGLHLAILRLPWDVTYVIGPGCLAWLFTVAHVEGRRLHVVLMSGIRYVGRPRVYVGGWRSVRPEPTWHPPRARVVRRRA